MLKNKGDTTCIKLIDFGLSKDYKGQPVMSTPSGSVRYFNWGADKLYSLTTLHLRFSSKTILQRLTCGRWGLCSTSCCRARFLSLAGMNSKLLPMWSRANFTSIMMLSKMSATTAKIWYVTSWWRMWTKDSPQRKHTITDGLGNLLEIQKIRSWRDRPYLKLSLLRCKTLCISCNSAKLH